MPSDFEEYDVIVWGLGNHPSDSGDYQTHRGTNNATLYNADVLEPTCKCAPYPKFQEQASKQVPRALHTYGMGECIGSCTKRGGGGCGRTCLKPIADGTSATEERPCYDHAADGCAPWTSTMAHKVVWLQPHYRPHAGSHEQESRRVTDLYAAEMPGFLKHTCGVQHVVNPYSMTKGLVEHIDAIVRRLESSLNLKESGAGSTAACHDSGHIIPDDGFDKGRQSGELRHLANCYGMQSDPAHWGMAVNLIKAHGIFESIQQMYPT